MAVTLVTVETFDNALEAGYWGGLLEAQGIPVALADQALVTWDWLYARAAGNIKLQVPGTEAARASAIFDALRKEHPYRLPVESTARRALRVAILGILAPPLQLYSLWLIARLVPRIRELPAVDRRRIGLAALLDLCLPFFVAAWWVVY